MWNLVKDFIMLFTTKARRTLHSLEKIEDRAFKVKEALEVSRKALKEAHTETQTQLNIFNQYIKERRARVAELEKCMLKADADGNADDVNTFNSEIITLEAEILEYEATVTHLQNTVDDLIARRAKFDEDIVEAERVIRVSQARYKSAQAILKANAGHLDDAVYKEIEGIKQASVELQQRASAVDQVEAADRKKGLKDREKHYRNAINNVSAQDRLAALKAKNNA